MTTFLISVQREDQDHGFSSGSDQERAGEYNVELMNRILTDTCAGYTCALTTCVIRSHHGPHVPVPGTAQPGEAEVPCRGPEAAAGVGTSVHT